MPVAGCPGDGAGLDTIVLGPGTYDLETGAGGTEDGNESGDLDTGPASALRIVGAGAGATVIDGLRGDRAIDVSQGSSLSLEALTITRGRSTPGAPGGAIRSQGVLTVVRSSFVDNATGSGATATDLLDLNHPGGDGGAIWSGGPASPSVLISRLGLQRQQHGARRRWPLERHHEVGSETGRRRRGAGHRRRHGRGGGDHRRSQPHWQRWQRGPVHREHGAERRRQWRLGRGARGLRRGTSRSPTAPSPGTPRGRQARRWVPPLHR